MTDSATLDTIVSLAGSTVRVAIPLVLASIGGMFSERSGIVDIGLEGKMLAAAFAAAAVAHATGSAVAGLLAAMATGWALAMIHGFAAITHRGNQMVSGMAVNIVASGLTVTLANAWFGLAGRTPSLETSARFTPIDLPGTSLIRDIPVIGPIWTGVISGHSILVYLTVLMIPCVGWVIQHSRFGLRLRAVGDNPHALETAGVSVALTRYKALMVDGALCGVAGAYLATAQTDSFTQNMTAGRGFLALAALIFGKWRVWPTCFACVLFAFVDAAQVRLQQISLPGIGPVPVEAVQALPYILTVLLLAGFVGRAVAPRAIGIPYVKSR